MRKNTTLIVIVAELVGLNAWGLEPARDYPIHPTPAHQVQVTDSFWGPRLETNRTATIPASFQMCEETGRIENFKVAGCLSEKPWIGMFGFSDSDVFKVMEGAAYSLMAHADPRLETYLNALVGYVAAAQEDDGYLYTAFTARDRILDAKQLRCCYPRDNVRWLSEWDSHELYNVGHMFEAAVAHWEATGNPEFLEVAKKNADLLVRTFGPGKIELPPGHPEVELALVKVYRATGDRRYLDLARFFLDVRGRVTKDRPKLWDENRLDHKPLLEQEEATGHAVRAIYLYSAATDLAALTGDQALAQTVDRMWDSVVGKKTYITGGIGAMPKGEAFGVNYDLPNETAYAETCANLATCLWNHRMFLWRGDGKYIDVLERALYNGVLSGVALDGKTFFYPNPLASSGGYSRSKWFDCACCPTNICRFIPSAPGYVFASCADEIYVNLFMASGADFSLAKGKVRVEQRTSYPWDGKVEIRVTPELAGQRIALKVRIPGWARGEAFASDLYRFANESDGRYAISVNGEAVSEPVAKGYATIDRDWIASDVVTLELPMQARRVVANENVEADRGRVAVMRGPLVYCVEWPDIDSGKVQDVSLPDETVLESDFRKDLLGGVQVIFGTAQLVKPSPEANTGVSSSDSQNAALAASANTPLVAIPYYAWANRGPGEMAVWVRRSTRK